MGIDLSLSQRNDMSDSAWPLFTRGRVNQVNPFATPVSAQQMPPQAWIDNATRRTYSTSGDCSNELWAASGRQDGRAFAGEGSDEGSKSTTRQCLLCPLRSGCDSRGGSARERWRSSSHASSLANSLYLNLPVVLNLLPPRTLLTPHTTHHTPHTHKPPPLPRLRVPPHPCPTPQPRVLMFDLKGHTAQSITVLPEGTNPHSSMFDEAPPAPADPDTWTGAVSRHETDMGLPDDAPARWPDFLRCNLNSHSPQPLNDYTMWDASPFDVFGTGYSVMRRDESREKILDDMRYFLEECDCPQVRRRQIERQRVKRQREIGCGSFVAEGRILSDSTSHVHVEWH